MALAQRKTIAPIKTPSPTAAIKPRAFISEPRPGIPESYFSSQELAALASFHAELEHIRVANRQSEIYNRKSLRGCSSMAERQLPKLDTGVRFPSPAKFVFSIQGAGALSHNMSALKVTTGPVNARTSPRQIWCAQNSHTRQTMSPNICDLRKQKNGYWVRAGQ